MTIEVSPVSISAGVLRVNSSRSECGIWSGVHANTQQSMEEPLSIMSKIGCGRKAAVIYCHKWTPSKNVICWIQWSKWCFTSHVFSLLYFPGNLITSVGQQGSNPGEFKEPAFVCIGRNDDIIISDCRNSRVQVLNKFGEFQYQIGSKGSGKGQLQGPSGVTTDRYGHILVTDRVNNRIQVSTDKAGF